MRSKLTTPDPRFRFKSELKKTLGLTQATIYGVGIILGAGIYALIGEAAGVAGNSMWLSFVFAAFIAMFTAFSYAELTTLFPKSAAEFIYFQETTGSKAGAFFVGYTTIVTGIISASAVALGFATYCKLYLPVNPSLIAIGIIILLTLINLKGIQESALVNAIFTIIEVGGLLFIIVIGWRFVADTNLLVDINHQPLTNFSSFEGVIGAAALIFFAYIGFEDVANIAEETKNPKKVIPTALVLSLIISTIIYILVAMVAVSVVTPEQLAHSTQSPSANEGPLALVASQALNNPQAGRIFTLIALFATANTILVLLIVSSRMMYGIAREGSLPAIFGRLHKTNQTPIAAILFTCVMAIVFALKGDLGEVAKLTNIGVFVAFAATNFSLIAHRYKHRHVTEIDDSVFRCPINYKWFPVMPFIGLCFCLGMLLSQYWEPIELLTIKLPLVVFGMLIFITAFPVYWYWNTNNRSFDSEL